MIENRFVSIVFTYCVFEKSCYTEFMLYCSLTLFIAASIVHLAFCALKRNKAADATKVFLMPLLALTSALALVPRLPESRTAFACTLCALGFGCIGDILLLSVSEKRFMAGALSFFAGHIFWIVQYVFSPNGTSAYASGGRMFFPLALICFICYGIVLASTYVLLGKPKGVMGGGVIAYGVILCALNFTAINAVVNGINGKASLFYLAGSILFFISDGILSYTVFKKDIPHSRFIIMITYIAAQALLAAGCVLPYI